MPAMPTRYHVAVRRPDDEAILVLADGSMPGFRLDDAPPWQVVSPVVERLGLEHGLRVIALRTAWRSGPGEGPGDDDRLYEASWLGGPVPAGARWVDLADLDLRPTPLGDAIGRGALIPAAGDRQPWYRPGWFEGFAGWIDERLHDVGLHRHGPPRQVRSWGRSALVTVETDRGRWWAKQVPAVFAHEVSVTGLLSDVDPGIVAPVVAAEAATARLLMEDASGPILAREPGSTAAWLATMARLAEVQRVLARDLGALRVAGVPGADLAELSGRVPAILADDALLRVGRPDGLAEADLEVLRSSEGRLVAACDALARSSIGPSLDHGDLTARQVIVGEMGPVFLDWSDATIAHPFLAAASFLGDGRDVDPGIGGSLEAAYLAGWTGSVPGSVPESDATAALDLARIVHPLHMARLHVDRILPGLEQPWELERTVPRLLRSLVPRLGALPSILGE